MKTTEQPPTNPFSHKQLDLFEVYLDINRSSLTMANSLYLQKNNNIETEVTKKMSRYPFGVFDWMQDPEPEEEEEEGEWYPALPVASNSEDEFDTASEGSEPSSPEIKPVCLGLFEDCTIETETEPFPLFDADLSIKGIEDSIVDTGSTPSSSEDESEDEPVKSRPKNKRDEAKPEQQFTRSISLAIDEAMAITTLISTRRRFTSSQIEEPKSASYVKGEEGKDLLFKIPQQLATSPNSYFRLNESTKYFPPRSVLLIVAEEFKQYFSMRKQEGKDLRPSLQYRQGERVLVIAIMNSIYLIRNLHPEIKVFDGRDAKVIKFTTDRISSHIVNKFADSAKVCFRLLTSIYQILMRRVLEEMARKKEGKDFRELRHIYRQFSAARVLENY